MLHAFSPNGKILACGGLNGQIDFLSTGNWEKFLTIGGHEDYIRAITFSPDGKFLATGGDDGLIKIWSEGKELRKTGLFYADDDDADDDDADDDDADDDDADDDDADDDEPLPIKINCLKFLSNGILGAAYDACRYVENGGGGTVRYFDFNTLNTIDLMLRIRKKSYKVKDYYVPDLTSIAFSPDGKFLAAGASHPEIYDVSTGEEETFFHKNIRDVSSIAFSPDGKFLATGYEFGHIRMWEVGTRNLITTNRLHRHSVKNVSFSPDGKILASISDETIKLIYAQNFKEIQTLNCERGRSSNVSFSPDGKIFAASFDNTIKLWDSETFQLIRTL